MNEYVFVGAGPSNIFCVLEMLENGIDGNEILIIEKGKDPYKRQKNEVMNGFAGAGAFSDYKMLYSLTRGGELVKYTGLEKAEKMPDRIKKIIRRFHPDVSKIKTSGEKIPEDLESEIKKYFNILISDSEHIGTDYAVELNKNIYEHLLENKVNIECETEIKKVDFENKKIITNTMLYNYKELIIGVGKSGMNFLQEIINKYSLDTTNKSIQIGVRFESDHKYFKKLSEHFYDFKLQKDYEDGISVRTFCVNNGNAHVALENTNGLYSYNGHAYRENKEERDLTNFGIMLEMPINEDPLKTTQDYVKAFNFMDKGFNYSPGIREPTVDSSSISDMSVFDNNTKVFNIVFDFIKELNEVFNFNKDYILYIPEIKYVTKDIVLNKEDMSLPNFNNVHIVGDSAGGRGLFVSKSHGLHLADYFIEKERKNGK